MIRFYREYIDCFSVKMSGEYEKKNFVLSNKKLWHFIMRHHWIVHAVKFLSIYILLPNDGWKSFGGWQGCNENSDSILARRLIALPNRPASAAMLFTFKHSFIFHTNQLLGRILPTYGYHAWEGDSLFASRLWTATQMPLFEQYFRGIVFTTIWIFLLNWKLHSFIPIR